MTRRRTILAGLALQPFIAGASATFAAAEGLGRRYEVRTVEPLFIKVSAGVKLSSRLWLPVGRPGEKFPVVFEYIPYRTRDSYRLIDDHWGPQLASKGIAFARVDIRGSGDSEGLLEDEYLASEQQDGVDVIAWLAQQDWCNGAVGMRGLSWGGFSTLQVAAMAPPELKAIMPMCATDMRFWNDAHYVGGSPGLTNLKWAAGFEMVMSGPPDPAVVGDRWQDMWRERLAATPSIAARWLKHQSNDEYWRHGSVGVDYGRIKCPVYLVDGWADSYAESAERLLRGLKTPKKALFGPWGHIYPDLARPGPGLDWAYEEVRWWRRWLVGEDNGVMDGPPFRYFMPYATPAETKMADLPGRWASEAEWPSRAVKTQTYRLAPGRLQVDPPRAETVRYVADKVVGLAKPEWIPYAVNELPKDQRTDDAQSLVFDLPLAENLEILGAPKLRVRVRSNQPVCKLAARLCEVSPDGSSWLVTAGLLNLSFRNGPLEAPSPLTPGVTYDVEVPLCVIAHRFKAGSKVRLAISESLWPLVWPSPRITTLEFDLGEASLDLPTRPIPASEADFPIPVTHAGFSRGEPDLEILPEDAEGWVRVRGGWRGDVFAVPGVGTELSGSGPNMALEMRAKEPSTCKWTVSQSSRFHRGEWDCETRCEIVMTADEEAYRITETLKALKNGEPFFEETRSNLVPRQLT